ncbi:hypothetical protein Tco_0857251 [Tanacetum coccineum]|uniref:Uncharacterized protein n=1 Tax=Tanacetum coccineum TaxID=301880 RepID=A0ABQ5BBD0_9ASTR
MECNWKIYNGTVDMTPYLLLESSADSDDSNKDAYHLNDKHKYGDSYNRQEEQQHEQEQEQVAMEDDAESWSYDHSFHGYDHVKTHAKHHQAHRYDDGYHDDHKFHGHGHAYEDEEEDMDDDDDDKNWGDSKMVGQEKRCHDLVVDSSHLNDRQFWETCLAT